MDERSHGDDGFGSGAEGGLPADPSRISLDPLHGIVQGLASTAIGMTFIIASPASMLLILVLWQNRFRDFAKVEVVLIGVCGFLACLMILTMTIFGLVFGIAAILESRRQNRPWSLGMAGALLTVFSFLLWIFITVLWAFAIVSRF